MKPSYLCTNLDCDRIREGLTPYCSSCNHSKRKAARFAVKDATKVVKPIKKVSDGRKEANEAYKPLRLDYLKHQPVCEINLSGCTRKATQIHHASMSELDYLNTDTWFSACMHCHHRLETEISADERKKRGWLI